MSKSGISIYSSLDENVTQNLVEHISHHMPGEEININYFNDDKISNVNDLEKSGIKLDVFDPFFIKNENDFVLVLTSIRVAGEERIVSGKEKGEYIASFWNLDLTEDVSYLATIIYACIIKNKYGILSADHGDNCILSPEYYLPGLPTDLCASCKEKLPYNGALIARRLHGILYSDYYNGQTVICQHGFNTYANWFEEIVHILRRNYFQAEGFKYGRFGFFQLLFSHISSKKVKERFLQLYRDVSYSGGSNGEISVIAHSYGTLLIAEMLKENKDVILDKLILVNSIVDSGFNWAELRNRGQVRFVLNECACADGLPIIAKKIIGNAGASGTVGFDRDTEFVINNFNPDAGHSDLLNKDQCENIWIPFLADNSTLHKKYVSKAEPKWYVRCLDMIPHWLYKGLLWVGVPSLVVSGIWYIFS